MGVDLHVHTNASDGRDTPEQVVAKAEKIGLEAIAITDHDEVAGVILGQKASLDYRVAVIPGIEINTEYAYREIHILGYFINPADTLLLLRLEKIKQERVVRVKKIINRLRDLGFLLDLERVLEIAEFGSVGRLHIGRAMVEKGYTQSIQEAFTQYLVFGAAAYIPRYELTPFEALKMIQQAGGVAVLAHPGLAQQDALIPQLVKAGLLGLEVYYPEHTPEMTLHYANLAQEYSLVATGGSDYHGSGEKGESYKGDLGAVTVEYSIVKQLQYRGSFSTPGLG